MSSSWVPLLPIQLTVSCLFHLLPPVLMLCFLPFLAFFWLPTSCFAFLFSLSFLLSLLLSSFLAILLVFSPAFFPDYFPLSFFRFPWEP